MEGDAELGRVMLEDFAKRFVIRDMRNRVARVDEHAEWLRNLMTQVIAVNPWLNARVQ